MSLSQRVEALVNQGFLSEAMALLSQHETLPHSLMSLRAYIQTQTGNPLEAQRVAESLLRRHVEPACAATCWEIIGRSLLVHGRSRTDAIKSLQQARQIANDHLDAVAQSRLACSQVDALLHWVSIEDATVEIPGMRRLALKAGDAWSLISTHLLQAEVRTKHGSLSRADIELRTAGDLLSTYPNLVLEGRWALALAALKSLQSDFGAAHNHAERAIACAQRSGSLALMIPALGTLAHILIVVGKLQECERRLNEATKLARPGGPTAIGILDTRLQLAMARDDVPACEALLQQTSDLSAALDGGYSYYGLWHLLTRVKWFLRTSRHQEAVTVALDAIPRVERMADRNLLERMQLLAAEALGAVDRAYDGADLLARAVRANPDPPLDMIAEASRVQGCLARTDDPAAARAHFERAARILAAIGHHSARADVLRQGGLGAPTRPTALSLPAGAVRDPSDASSVGLWPGSRVVEAAAAVMELAAHPPLLGIETLALLGETRATARSALVEEDTTGVRRILAACPPSPVPCATAPGAHTTRLPLGALGTRTYELLVEPRPSPSARATVLAVERLLATSIALARARQQEREQAALWPEQTPEQQLGLICAAEPMVELVKTTRRVAASNVTVLITGETGAGKEVLARALHQASSRRDRIFMPFNCTAVPRDMLDAQLFGYRRGAFTGAHDDFAGIVRSAAGGTLFLDEIGELSLDVQPKLLRFLESGEILPLGETRPQLIDVRIVAATNADLDQLVNEGRFREDLYYRLQVIPLKVPPLRERREEIPLLAGALLDKFAREAQKPPLRISEEAMEHLVLHHWPGNVRQLANELRRLATLVEPGSLVMPDQLSPGIVASRRALPAEAREPSSHELIVRTDQSLVAATEQVERRFIQQALEQAGGNVERAAQLLGLSRKGLFLKRQRLGML
jgi:DNA-binding NtrC family response regulator